MTAKEKSLHETYKMFLDTATGNSLPVETLKKLAIEEIMGFGTTIDEKVFSLNGFLKLLKTQREQSEGLDMQWQFSPVFRRIASDTNSAVFADDATINLTVNNELVAMQLRVTTVFEFINSLWKIVHWHASKPENTEGEKDTFGIDIWKQKNAELEKLVEERTAELSQKNRELEVESALERVRSQAMAMQNSNDLIKSTTILFEELEKLQLNVQRSGIGIFNAKRKDCSLWTTVINDKGKKELATGSTSLTVHPMLIETFKSWKKQKPLSYILEGNELVDYYNIAEKSKSHLSKETIGKSYSLPKEYYLYTPFGSGGIYLFSDVATTASDKQIIKRFAEVFHLTYTRYEDLQKAEAQNREAEIELALERVRARTMAMQHSDELGEVSFLLDAQVRGLGLKTWGCAFNIYGENDSTEWFSSENGTLPTYKTPRENLFLSYYEAGQKGESLLVTEYSGKACVAHYEYLSTIPVMGDALKEMIANGGSFPTQQIDHVTFFKYGYLLFITLEQAPEAHDIFIRFAKVFEQTYTRFLDLQKAEAQAVRAEHDLIEIKIARKKAEEALAELKSTQTQLIQSEKMASLGELTAGIAHEIQNPLNFVNNFSEVSAELLAEMQEEINNGNLEDAKEILTDVLQNLEKINHHGKRADAIVKGMLQHSRSSSGKKEPTDLNAICDEYLRLSYHGLRAKDKSFNASMKTDFDTSIGKINLIPQDFGRVVLNLITNAFYAVTEKKNSDVVNYEPTVSISTKKENDKIIISVSDNGNGMPQEIIDKIFQPFFTTKPTGKGTGLGLSMSYDIVTKGHNGELKVQSVENEGTTLSIILPI